MNLVLARKTTSEQQFVAGGDNQRRLQQSTIINEGIINYSPPFENDGGELEEHFNLVHIRGPSIRYIVFGPDVDIAGVIKAGRDRERAASDKYRRGTRKAR